MKSAYRSLSCVRNAIFFFFSALVHWRMAAWYGADRFFFHYKLYLHCTDGGLLHVGPGVCVCVWRTRTSRWNCIEFVHFFFASQIKWKKMKASQRSRCQFATYYTIQARMGKHTRSNVHNMRLELILYEQLPCASHIYIYICGFLHYIVEWNANDF